MRYGKLEPEEKAMVTTLTSYVRKCLADSVVLQTGGEHDPEMKCSIKEVLRDSIVVDVDCDWDETRTDRFKIKVIMVESANE